MSKRCLKKNQTTPRPSEHPPGYGGKNVKTFSRWDQRLQILLFLTFSALVVNPKKTTSTLHGGHSRSDLPICSPWTFRENHSPNIICTYCEQEKPAHCHGSLLLRLGTHQIQNRTRDAHKISPHGTMTKRTPAMNWDHAVSWGGGLG